MNLDIDLLEVRHNNAMITVTNMIGVEGFGSITETQYCNNGRYYTTYQLDKRQSIAVASRLNTTLLMRIIDRWQELEKTLSKPKTTLELLKEAVADLEAKELQLSQSNAEKARIYNEFIGSMTIDGLRDFKSTADRIGIHGFGRNTMLKCLRDKKWLTKDNKPYRAQIESKRFVVRTFRHEYDNGDIWSRDVVLVTEKGIVDILLIAQEWLKSQMDMPAIAPPPPAPAPTIELLDDRLTLQDYYKVGWTDKLLIEHNKAKYV